MIPLGSSSANEYLAAQNHPLDMQSIFAYTSENPNLCTVDRKYHSYELYQNRRTKHFHSCQESIWSLLLVYSSVDHTTGPASSRFSELGSRSSQQTVLRQPWVIHQGPSVAEHLLQSGIVLNRSICHRPEQEIPIVRLRRGFKSGLPFRCLSYPVHSGTDICEQWLKCLLSSWVESAYIIFTSNST